MKKSHYGDRMKLLKAELDEFLAKLNSGEILTPYLLRLMNEKHLTPPQVYRRANLDRQVFNRLIQSSSPARASKQTLLQICIGMRANVNESAKLLATCGFGFELASCNDQAYLFCISRGYFDMQIVEEAKDLLENDLDLSKM